MSRIEKEVFTVKGTITSAQLKAMLATDVELVPAPGTGKVLVPHYVILTMRKPDDATLTAYAMPNTDHTADIGGMTFANDTAVQAFFEAAARTTVVLRPGINQTVLTENAAIKLAVGGTGEMTTGNGLVDFEVAFTEADVTEV